MRNAFISAVINAPKYHGKIVFITVDQQTGFDSQLKELLGNRFIIEAISEQSIVGFASGLAAEGYIPIVFNHAAFSIRRSYEQILLDCCLQNRKIILLGMGGGFATAHLGPSHTTFDDIALTRVMPNMDVFVPADAKEINFFFEDLINSKNSVYVRLSKYGKPHLEKFECFEDSNLYFRLYGSENIEHIKTITVISTGPISINVSDALTTLAGETKANFLQIHIPFVKPIPYEKLIKLTSNTEQIIIFEEHSVIGGLGSACLEALRSFNTAFNTPITQYGVKDVFIHKYGSQEEIWEYLGLDKTSIYNIIKKFCFDHNKSLTSDKPKSGYSKTE